MQSKVRKQWKCGRLWKHQKMNILWNHHHKDKTTIEVRGGTCTMQFQCKLEVLDICDETRQHKATVRESQLSHDQD
ncbi:hypothetical protein YC2023_103753 [Brassica napus]